MNKIISIKFSTLIACIILGCFPTFLIGLLGGRTLRAQHPASATTVPTSPVSGDYVAHTVMNMLGHHVGGIDSPESTHLVGLSPLCVTVANWDKKSDAINGGVWALQDGHQMVYISGTLSNAHLRVDKVLDRSNSHPYTDASDKVLTALKLEPSIRMQPDGKLAKAPFISR